VAIYQTNESVVSSFWLAVNVEAEECPSSEATTQQQLVKTEKTEKT
jgi:hypothetical protein